MISAYPQKAMSPPRPIFATASMDPRDKPEDDDPLSGGQALSAP